MPMIFVHKYFLSSPTYELLLSHLIISQPVSDMIEQQCSLVRLLLNNDKEKPNKNVDI